MTIPLSITMTLKLFKSSRLMKNRTAKINIIIILLYSLLIWAASTETPENVTFKVDILTFLNYFICLVTILTFLGWTRFIWFSEEHAISESICFTVSTMWLSPFIAEMYIFGKWLVTGVLFEKASYMTLGGAGTQDILFWQGFLTLIILVCFHMLRKRVLIKIQSRIDSC